MRSLKSNVLRAVLGCILAATTGVACSEDDPAGVEQEPCTGSLAAYVSMSGDPLHSHRKPLLCEEDRGSNVDYRLRGTDHEHAVGFSKLEVADILGGQALGKNSTAAQGHTHWTSFHHDR